MNILKLITLLCTVGLTAAGAKEVTINPSDDAVVASALQPSEVYNNGPLIIRGSGQGVVIFPAPVIRGSFSNAVLTINPYSVPLRGSNVDIYGISEQTGFVSANDANAGTFLGTLHLPGDYFFGDASFDVTDFMATNHTPYIGFNLRTVAGGVNDAIGLDIFSSIEHNYGHPSQLHVSAEQIILAPTIVCPDPLVLECTNDSAVVGTLQANVVDTIGLPLEVVWTLDGAPQQTNNIPSGGDITASNLTFTANFGDGEHTVAISASNGQTLPATCSTTVTVRDSTAPTVLAIFATPDSIGPPNHRMVSIGVTVSTIDNCDPSPTVQITNVTSSEPQGRFAPDWQITGPLSVDLRAERLGGSDRIYTIYLDVTDSSGNRTTTTTAVTVLKSRSVLH